MSTCSSSVIIVRSTGLAIIAVAAFASFGCKGFNAGLVVIPGTKTGDLIASIDEATAPYVIVNLASGARTTALTIPDLTSNAAYVGNQMVFRRVVGLGGNYLLGVFEVTQAQWQAIAPATPQSWTLVDAAVVGATAVAGSMPAFNLSNDGIVAGLAAYNVGKDVQLALPSDAEWEFACAAGGSGAWSWGNAVDRATIQAHARVAGASTALGPLAVGGLTPNAWGFYDMHGNVWEWSGTGAGAHLRGGSWSDAAILAKTANVIGISSGVYSDTHHALAGMRLVLRQ